MEPDVRIVVSNDHDRCDQDGKTRDRRDPAKLRARYGLEEGALVIVDSHEDGVLIRPAVALPVERYSCQRKAEFLLSNTVDDADYEWACRQVRALGLDPESVPHRRPSDR